MEVSEKLKTMLVAGNPDYAGARIVRKIIADGQKVRASKDFIERRDILCEKDLGFLGRNNLHKIEENFQDQEKLKSIISGCDVVIYLDQIFHENDYKPNYEDFTSLVDNAKALDVERFVYVSENSRHNACFIEYLKEKFSDDFAVIVIKVPLEDIDVSTKKLELSVNLLTKSVVKEHKVTLYNGKQKKAVSIRVTPKTWYVPRDSHVFDFYVNGLADLCSNLYKQPSKQMQKSSWAMVITCKVFLNRFPIFSKIFKRLKNPRIPGLRFIQFLLISFQRLFDVFMMMFLLHVWPEQMYRFSSRKGLPPKEARFSKKDRPAIPIGLIKSRTSDIPKMKEANIVMRGPSFDLKKLNKLEGPTFLVSFWEPVETKKEVIYVTGRAQAAKWFGDMGYKAIFVEGNSIDKAGDISPRDKNYGKLWYEKFIDEGVCQRIATLNKIHLSWKPPLWAPTNSGLAAVGALSYFVEKMNVYGWDYYLKSSPDTMSYWQLFSNLYHLKTDILLTRTHLESTMINYYYAYHISKLPNINICGPLGELGKHEKLIEKIERALFNV